MKTWLMNLIINYIVSAVTSDQIKDWAEKTRNFVLPKLHQLKDELIQRLKDEAKKTDNKLDDKAVEILDKYLEALFPDTAPFK